ncbi:MAG: hypothetical protein ACLT3D_08475 [Lawsonibacter sp.]
MPVNDDIMLSYQDTSYHDAPPCGSSPAVCPRRSSTSG